MDDCDFETLAEMLENDDQEDEMNSENSIGQEVSASCDRNSGKSGNKDAGEELEEQEGVMKHSFVQNAEMDASSDDDIDDDELDKLAALVAEENETTTPREARCDDQNHLNGGEEEQPSCEEANGGHCSSPNSEMMEDDQEQSGDSDEDSDMKRQLSLMKEQMKLLEAQMKKKKSKKSPKHDSKTARENKKVDSKEKSNSTHHKISKDKVDSSSRKNNQNSSTKSPKERKTHAESAKCQAKVNPGSTKKLNQHPSTSKGPRLLEDNIFDVVGSITGKPLKTPENIDSATNKSAKGKTNMERKNQVNNSTKKSSFYGNKRKEEEHALFGEDSDSDWSDMDGEKSSYLSKEGSEINKIMKKGQRVAHAPKFDDPPPKPQQAEPKSTTPSKPPAPEKKINQSSSFAPPSSAYEKSSSASASEMQDYYSGLRLINPRISHDGMRMRMEKRRHIRMSVIHSRVNTADMDGDWVTIGVIVSKSEPKMSSKGKQFSIWTMSDLDDCDKPVSFFLFGQVHQALWKTSQGTAIGILNATIMPSAEKYQKKYADEVAMTANDPKQVMILGVARDLGVCKGKSFKSGRACTNFINTKKGDFCVYHVQAQYKKVSAKRAELQAGYSGHTPKSFEQKLFSKSNQTVSYGGQTFTTSSLPSGGNKKQNVVSIKSLQHHQMKNKSGKLGTLQLHKLLPEDEQKLADMKCSKAAVKAEKEKKFHNLLSVPTPGAMNFVKHLVKKENLVEESGSQKTTVHSIKAKDMLKKHAEELAEKKRKHRLQAAVGSPKLGGGPSLPQLGRGLAPGEDVEIDLDAGPPAANTSLFARNSHDEAKKNLAKAKAIMKITGKGGIGKKDPNAVKKEKTVESVDKVKKRVAESSTATSMSSSSDNEVGPPPKKKSRLLGNLDLDDPEVQKLLKKKSKHASALTEEERERFDKYFDVLEKKEQMEDKMASTRELKVKAVSCRQCIYTHPKPLDTCKEQGHTLTWHQATRRFFQCNKCKGRTSSLRRLPKEGCKNCDGNWERTSMLKEKNTKLPGEELVLRGEERKYVNS